MGFQLKDALNAIHNEHERGISEPRFILLNLLEDFNKRINGEQYTLFAKNKDITNLKFVKSLTDNYCQYNNNDDYLRYVIYNLNKSIYNIEKTDGLIDIFSAFFSIYECYRSDLSKNSIEILKFEDVWNIAITKWINEALLELNDENQRHNAIYVLKKLTWVPAEIRSELIDALIGVVTNDFPNRIDNATLNRHSDYSFNSQVEGLFNNVTAWADQETCFKIIDNILTVLDQNKTNKSNINVNLEKIFLSLRDHIPEKHRADIIERLINLSLDDKVSEEFFRSVIIAYKDWPTINQKTNFTFVVLDALNDKLLETKERAYLFLGECCEFIPDALHSQVFNAFWKGLNSEDLELRKVIYELFYKIIPFMPDEATDTVVKTLLDILSSNDRNIIYVSLMLSALKDLKEVIPSDRRLVFSQSIIKALESALDEEYPLSNRIRTIIELMPKFKDYFAKSERTNLINVLMKGLYENSDISVSAAKTIAALKDWLTSEEQTELVSVFLGQVSFDESNSKWWQTGKPKTLSFNALAQLKIVIPEDKQEAIINHILDNPYLYTSLQNKDHSKALVLFKDYIPKDRYLAVAQKILLDLPSSIPAIVPLKTIIPDSLQKVFLTKLLEACDENNSYREARQALLALKDWWVTHLTDQEKNIILTHVFFTSDNELEIKNALNYLNQQDVLKQPAQLSMLLSLINNMPDKRNTSGFKVLFTYVYQAYKNNIGLALLSRATEMHKVALPDEITMQIVEKVSLR